MSDDKKRRCTICKEVKPCAEYYSDRRTKDRCTAKCKICFRKYHNTWKNKNREKMRAHYSRMYFERGHRFARYGVTKEWYNLQLFLQDNRCAICRREETHITKGRLKSLAIDHNADTGKVRGLLCAECNTGIGKLRHSVEIMNSAVEYIRKHTL